MRGGGFPADAQVPGGPKAEAPRVTGIAGEAPKDPGGLPPMIGRLPLKAERKGLMAAIANAAGAPARQRPGGEGDDRAGPERVASGSEIHPGGPPGAPGGGGSKGRRNDRRRSKEVLGEGVAPNSKQNKGAASPGRPEHVEHDFLGRGRGDPRDGHVAPSSAERGRTHSSAEEGKAWNSASPLRPLDTERRLTIGVPPSDAASHAGHGAAGEVPWSSGSEAAAATPRSKSSRGALSPPASGSKGGKEGSLEGGAGDEDNPSPGRNEAGEGGKGSGGKERTRSAAASARRLPDDGHQWHKYGHKTLMDSSFSRAYYRCAQRATGCLAKKTVDFPLKKLKELRITYDGTHNHGPSSSPFNAAAVVVRHKGQGAEQGDRTLRLGARGSSEAYKESGSDEFWQRVEEEARAGAGAAPIRPGPGAELERQQGPQRPHGTSSAHFNRSLSGSEAAQSQENLVRRHSLGSSADAGLPGAASTWQPVWGRDGGARGHATLERDGVAERPWQEHVRASVPPGQAGAQTGGGAAGLSAFGGMPQPDQSPSVLQLPQKRGSAADGNKSQAKAQRYDWAVGPPSAEADHRLTTRIPGPLFPGVELTGAIPAATHTFPGVLPPPGVFGGADMRAPQDAFVMHPHLVPEGIAAPALQAGPTMLGPGLWRDQALGSVAQQVSAMFHAPLDRAAGGLGAENQTGRPSADNLDLSLHL